MKSSILLPQPLLQSSSKVPPDLLPQSILAFLSSAFGMHEAEVECVWDSLKSQIWDTAVVDLTLEDYALFKLYGWERGISRS